MAWPRIKNSRSSAQPGTHPHDGVQATVTPANDAEPPPGSGQNVGVSGTTHAVAYDGSPGAPDPAARGSRRLRRIRYAHAANDETPAAPPAEPLLTALPPTGTPASGIAPPAGEPPAAQPPTVDLPRVEPPAVPATGMPLADTVLSGTVVPGPARAGDEPDDYDGTAGLVYEAPRGAHDEPPADEPVRNEGLGIFGGVATTEVPDDDAPTREFERQPAEPSGAEPEPGRVIAIGAAWNQPVTPPAASSGPEESKPNPFGRILGMRLGGQPEDDGEPRPSIRDLPIDVQGRFIKVRIIIVLVIGVVSFAGLRNWALTITFMILAWIVDSVRRSRSTAMYVNGGAHPGARKATSKQLRRMRRDGYFTLDARPIPGSREVIDHLVIGPTGVYAIDSEKWDPKLPIRTWNGKKLYHGPASQKDRLEHAVWEATQASELLSGALGIEIKVRPALAIYGPKIPWNITTIRNVDVFTGSALGKYLKARGRMRDGVTRLTREEVRTIYDTAARMLPGVAPSETYTPVG